MTTCHMRFPHANIFPSVAAVAAVNVFQFDSDFDLHVSLVVWRVLINCSPIYWLLAGAVVGLPVGYRGDGVGGVFTFQTEKNQLWNAELSRDSGRNRRSRLYRRLVLVIPQKSSYYS